MLRSSPLARRPFSAHRPAADIGECIASAKVEKPRNHVRSPHRAALQFPRGLALAVAEMRHTEPANASFRVSLVSRIIRGAMEISKDQLKEFITRIFDNFKTIDLELSACKAVLGAVHIYDPHDPIIEMVRDAKKNPRLIQQVDSIYAKRLALALAAIEQVSADQALAEFLKSWSPQGPPN